VDLAKVERPCPDDRQDHQDPHDAAVRSQGLCFPSRVLTYSTDMALIKDKSFKTYATKYAKSEEEFFKE
jgi:hypothetical protein